MALGREAPEPSASAGCRQHLGPVRHVAVFVVYRLDIGESGVATLDAPLLVGLKGRMPKDAKRPVVGRLGTFNPLPASGDKGSMERFSNGKLRQPLKDSRPAGAVVFQSHREWVLVNRLSENPQQAGVAGERAVRQVHAEITDP